MATMDIETPQEQPTTAAAQTTSKPRTKQYSVRVDAAHPFALDAYISQYSGRTVIQRLRYIAEECESLAPTALEYAVKLLARTPDVNAYQNVIRDYNGRGFPKASPLEVDAQRVESIVDKNTSERERLETELKTYTSNMIKESIRMGQRDLGGYYWSLGDYSQALKHYNKCREYCTTPQQILDNSLTILQLLLENSSYSHISTYVYKADGILNPADGSGEPVKKSRSGAPAGSAAAVQEASANLNTEKDKAQAKIHCASAIALMANGQYERAAFTFSKLGKQLDDWLGTVVAPSDIAIYGTLCGMASMTRSALKVNYADNEAFSYFYEQEPHARDLLDAFMGSRFKTVLELMERHSSRHALDVHLGHHVTTLAVEIRNRAIVLYFQPFSSIQLEKMSTAFGLSVHDIEKTAVQLIQEGRIKARIDSTNKILKAKDTDPRTVLFKRAIETGKETEASTRKLLLRMKLVQADLTVKAPKGQQNAPAALSGTVQPQQWGAQAQGEGLNSPA